MTWCHDHGLYDSPRLESADSAVERCCSVFASMDGLSVQVGLRVEPDRFLRAIWLRCCPVMLLLSHTGTAVPDADGTEQPAANAGHVTGAGGRH